MGKQVKRRGHVEKRPNGKYRAIAYAGIDPITRKKRYLKKTVETPRQAEIELTKLLSQIDERRHPRSAVTAGEVVDMWLDVAELAIKTRRRYVQLINAYIKPTFGDRPVAELDVELLERFYARLQRCNKLCSGTRRRGHTCKPLSGSTIRQIHFIIRASLDRAVRWKYLGINEAALAEPPAFGSPAPDPPSAEEAAELLNDAWRDPAWGMMLWLVMVTGCRRGEACALRWTDIDLNRRKLSISRSVFEDDGTIHEKETKARQERKVTLDSYTIELLRAYRATCEELCKSLDVDLPRSACVFSLAPDFSTPIRPDTVTQRYRRIAKRNNLRSTRIHALRHYSATELLSAGIDLRTVAGRLGHGSGGATTLRYYAAWVEEADNRAADAIAGVVPRPDPLSRKPRYPYEVLAGKLREAIEDGTYPDGAVLPTSIELAAEHNVSVGTVSRAIGLLKAAGLVTADRGQRTTVCRDQGPLVS